MIRGWSPRVPKCLLACPWVVVHFDLVGTAPNDYRSFQFIISGNYKIYFPLLTQASLASPSVLYAIVAWLGFNALRIVVNVAPVATFCMLCTYAVTLPCASGILVAIAFTPLGLAWISFSQWGFKEKVKRVGQNTEILTGAGLPPYKIPMIKLVNRWTVIVGFLQPAVVWPSENRSEPLNTKSLSPNV